MNILLNQKQKTLTLHTANTTYQMLIGPYGHLLHLYYGKKIEGSMEYLLTYKDRGFTANPNDAGRDRTYSMDALPQEFPSFGTGDFRTPAINIKHQNGINGCDFRYFSHEIDEGKYEVPGLPFVHTTKKALTLKVILKDVASEIYATISYGILEDQDIITRSVSVENKDNSSIYLDKISSACLDFVTGEFEVLHFHGRHGMERIAERSPMIHGTQRFGSIRGASSHQQNPFLIIAGKDTTEDAGSCYGMSFLYSGNFLAEAELDQYRQSRFVMGLSDVMFSYEVKPMEIFHAPEVILSYSEAGLARLSQNYHDVIRHHVCRGPHKLTRRPILINNWEATYFDFNGEKLKQIAKQASTLGVEMFVLDDGWFGQRDSDETALGDWFVNEEKLGAPLASIANEVNALGMKFGLWIEPEMVSEESKLYKEHPDWVFEIPGRAPVRSRYQLVLDFSRKEVVDYIFNQINCVLNHANIEYIKMDMNRSITEVYSASAEYQNRGAILHRYVLGVYDFLERLLASHPNLLIEGCCGGGGRFDAGMLYYTPQIWCSDNTDAIERIKIQYGTSFGYPISSMGSHVSAVPNHQTGRSTSITTRSAVAMAGSFGYELDLNLITEEERELVKRQIGQYKEYWSLIQEGRYYRLSNPYGQSDFAAWEFVLEDQSEALLTVVTLGTECNSPVSYVMLKGLDPTLDYRVAGEETRYNGAALMYGGIPIPTMENEYEAWQLHLIACNKKNA